ncbi:MAG: PIG-L family deacetylase [Acidobacteriaceae bacterium]|nr:PIG-L family deacetylase [Acidobacteriaceae bacterium]
MSFRVLCICAHPDDECFAFGGALSLAVQRGAETYVLCATDGQAATNRGSSSSGKELGQIRRAEFEASCNVLRTSGHELLDYQDAQLEFEPLSAIAQKLVTRIRAIRPHIILTFGGDGALNTHPDHTSISAATTAAFHWAGHPRRFPQSGELWQPQRLFYLSGSQVLPDRHAPLLAPWTLALDVSSVVEIKMEAFRQHVSQAPVMASTQEYFKQHGSFEHYTLAASSVPQPARQSSDLFEGVAEL